jgi:aldose 1-epimerase
MQNTLRYGTRWTLLAPDTGGSVAAFFDVLPDGTLHHWLRPATAEALAEHDPLGMASFPLMPYCNRLRDARFSFDGQSIDLSADGNAFPHALHGHAWRRPWARDGHNAELHANTATVIFTHEPEMTAGKHWPYPYQASQTFTLDEAGLHVTLQARNAGRHAMPFGMGHHPYYPRTPGVTIRAEVRAMWAATPDLLPTALTAHPAVKALASAEGMMADAFDLDNNFAGWQRTARIVWPYTGRTLRLEASPPFDHLVIYSPVRQPDLLCVEPVSNTADFLNLDQSVDSVGGTVLAPGETLTGSFSWIPE